MVSFLMIIQNAPITLSEQDFFKRVRDDNSDTFKHTHICILYNNLVLQVKIQKKQEIYWNETMNKTSVAWKQFKILESAKISEQQQLATSPHGTVTHTHTKNKQLLFESPFLWQAYFLIKKTLQLSRTWQKKITSLRSYSYFFLSFYNSIQMQISLKLTALFWCLRLFLIFHFTSF